MAKCDLGFDHDAMVKTACYFDEKMKEQWELLSEAKILLQDMAGRLNTITDTTPWEDRWTARVTEFLDKFSQGDIPAD